ncbi:MAG TPA: phage tail sheath subtilisin-like domain-containing protein [Methanocella sp.]|uniref:phage tail sheath subtilisin-like domain-containing protein n=1 Tax=Methanocella sp. TaxID=2052833 RepID=UPI002BE894B1|nr:phage tail sheath subtilisin-like domain-containing protein [Methanocella sp.]HTY90431.1 phage tail sheath subtilisin-like domain-containing protein [Methanocella sp.]
MTRILPGVEIQVIKEIVPQQLNPSGVVALIGTTEKGEPLVPMPVSSYAEFADKFGSSEKFTVTRDAKQAFQNGVFQVVVVPISGQNGTKATLTLKDHKGRDTAIFTAKSSGEEGNKITIKVEAVESSDLVRLAISDGANVEIYDGVNMNPSGNNYLVDSINKKSALITAEDQHSKSKSPDNNPEAGETVLSGGVTGVVSKADYEAALDKLEAEPDVDIVAACEVIDPEIHALIEAHCLKMSIDAKNRIGLGTVSRGESIKDISNRTLVMSSDRFVLVAPYGCLGAVAGLMSRLNYYESPTFKPISGIAKLERTYTPSEEMEMLKAGVMPLEAQRGRGIVVVKGISTSKEQISVTRIADHAVRSVKSVADLFIGTLNSPSGRAALKGKISELLSRMESEGALVPSTDGKEPPFLVDVYSSELDFAQGIVRVNIAVRPVRAMDYIYATIKVEA